MRLRVLSKRRRALCRVAVSTVLLASSTTACGVFSTGSASATWVLAPNQDVNATTSSFEVLVTRTGCNGGVTGEVLPPVVERRSGQVVLTFTVEPDDPSSAPCRSNDAVRYRVHLDDALGDARLVDGYCTGDHTGDDVDCMPNGVRYDPR